MSNEDVLRGIVDGADAEAEAAQDAIDALQDQIDILQEKQDALKYVLDNTKTDLEEEIDATSVISVFHTYDDYYTGTLSSINDNIVEWQLFKKISTEVTRHDDDEFIIQGDYNIAEFTGSGLSTMTYNPAGVTASRIVHYRVEIDATDSFKWSERGGLNWEETGVTITGGAQTLSDGATVTFGSTTGYTIGDYWDFWWVPIGSSVYFDTTDSTAFIESTVISVTFDTTSQSYVEVNMPGTDKIPTPLTGLLEYISEPNGTGWDYDSTTNTLIDFIDEFEFANQYIHTPLGIDGTYGTKDLIASLGTGKTIQQNNKSNAIESETKLVTYASPPS